MKKQNNPVPHFTVEEANAMLPLVRRIVEDLKNLSTEMLERRERLSILTTNRERREGEDPYTDELIDMKRGLEEDNTRILEYLDELQELGVEPKGITEGLVDFPTLIEGNAAYLCWKLGEPEVAHWHGQHEGFSDRQPLPTIAGALTSGDA